MQTRNRFQYEIATGRTTLPVAAFITIIIWVISTVHDWMNLGSLLCAGMVSYILIEMDTRYTLIRTRTTLPSALFLLFYSALTFMHHWSLVCLIPILFLLSLSGLFRSYESTHASTTVFHSFFWIGLTSLLLPNFIWLAPLLYIHMIPLRSLNAKSFFAGLAGISIPYWFILCYYIYFDNIQGFINLVIRTIHFQPIDYTILQPSQYVSWAVIFILSVIFIILYLQNAYKDKVQTRFFLKTIIFMGLWIHVFIFCQPQFINAMLLPALIPAAIIGGHVFALTFSKVTHILLITTFSLCGLLCLFNLWMHSFNF